MIENSGSAAAQQKLQRQSNHAGGSNALAQSAPAHASRERYATRIAPLLRAHDMSLCVEKMPGSTCAQKCDEKISYCCSCCSAAELLCCSGALHQEIAPQNAHPLRQDIICQKLNAEVRQRGSRHRAIRTHTCFQTYKNATLGKCTA